MDQLVASCYQKNTVSQLPWMQLEHVDLAMECIGSSSLATVLEVGHDGYCMPALTAMFYNVIIVRHLSVLSLPVALHALYGCIVLHSKDLHDQPVHTLFHLKRALSVRSRPRMRCKSCKVQSLQHHTGWCPALITYWAGKSVTGADFLSNDLLIAAEQGLQAMHSRRVSHGDIRLSNILLDKVRLVFCDFGPLMLHHMTFSRICNARGSQSLRNTT